MRIDERLARADGIYLLTPDLAHADFGQVESNLLTALQAGVQIIQFRHSSPLLTAKLVQARALRELSAGHNALLLIEDDVELAASVQADGVHLSSEDVGIATARQRLGADALIGMSCYGDLALAHAAQAQGAQLVSFGTLFASQVKPHAQRVSLELLTSARRECPRIKVVGVGGIDSATVGAVAAAGAHLAALITAMFSATDPAATARDLTANFKQHQWTDERQPAPAS